MCFTNSPHAGTFLEPTTPYHPDTKNTGVLHVRTARTKEQVARLRRITKLDHGRLRRHDALAPNPEVSLRRPRPIDHRSGSGSVRSRCSSTTPNPNRLVNALRMKRPPVLRFRARLAAMKHNIHYRTALPLHKSAPDSKGFWEDLYIRSAVLATASGPAGRTSLDSSD